MRYRAPRAHPFPYLRFVFGALSDSDQENGALAFRVGREEAYHVVVEKSEAGRAEALGVSAEVQLSAKNARLKLRGAIAAIAEALQNGAQVREEKNVHGRVGGQLLPQSEVPGIGAEISRL